MCRACLEFLYRTQRAAPAHRHQLTPHRVVGRPGVRSPENLPDLPPKPPRMHWRTYDRLADAHEAAEEPRLAAPHTVTVARTLTRLGG